QHLLAVAGHVLPHEGAAGPGALAGRPRPERAHALLRPSGDRADVPPPALRRAVPLLVALRAGERAPARGARRPRSGVAPVQAAGAGADRKSTRLNSSHVSISYAVFCLKKKKEYALRRERARWRGAGTQAVLAAGVAVGTS